MDKKNILGPKDYDPEHDFKPYVQSQMHAFPTVYPQKSWAYPPGTQTRAILGRWEQAGLVMGARDHKGATQVHVGPQFYNLSGSDQRGLAQAIGQIYGKQNYFLVDVNTGKAVGVYTPTGLQMY